MQIESQSPLNLFMILDKGNNDIIFGILRFFQKTYEKCIQRQKNEKSKPPNMVMLVSKYLTKYATKMEQEKYSDLNKWLGQLLKCSDLHLLFSLYAQTHGGGKNRKIGMTFEKEFNQPKFTLDQ